MRGKNTQSCLLPIPMWLKKKTANLCTGYILYTFCFLYSNCGVIDPSWAELSHFAHFLSIQLKDCQECIFCIPELLADTGLQGFKSFVVRFMVQMAKDFATPSLNMSEENPSQAMGNGGGNGRDIRTEQPEELATFQLRRRWESRFVWF